MKKKEMNTLWDDVYAWLTDATRTAIQGAEDLSRRGRLKIDIMNLSRKIEKKMAKLGGIVYDRVSKTPDAPLIVDADIKRLVHGISKLESERTEKQKEYQAEKKKN
ncbi:hypothetical protein CH330_02440 [candidate division WOR-3 bacterium JGI_Cruoil_03_51_56]|uniref:Uncharacterized protein n=1 Tax=candidate division WOR-3 bacterium JGI_Cruoil_03_51_56 TaxID=1973747 RepID=A0A235BW59_UNCW3|nr:MAG: hypothetical protein CH330_02440 [candidate division WOR-3 bacterium JGI_Cruoil_03_51_56]